ncbi:hypothetical protein ACJJJB_00295 (plasmid) [Microbulbifer sp. ANSA001]|uniref:hypothetical protein n=1 Tax=Microbulbifer sp. ANSA001 TaxID=3243358 RepID=UPI004041DFCD
MFDAITYCPDLSGLAASLKASLPEYVRVDEDSGEVEFLVAKTPTVKNGQGESLALVRVEDLVLLQSIPGLQVLASAPASQGTPTAAFEALFQDMDALAIYNRVYDRSARMLTDEEGNQSSYTPPDYFGVFA